MTANYSFYFHREPGWHVSRGWLKSPPKNVNRIVADGRVFFFFQECRTLKDSCLYPFFRIFLPCYDFPFFLPSSFSVFQSPFPPSFFSFLWIPVLVSFVHLLHLSCISSSFPLCIRPCPRPSNARVNIIMCTPFLCSSYIQEFYVLQHPYNSTL